MDADEQEFRALIQRIRQGSNEAARELVEHYGPCLLQAVRRLLHKGLRSKFDSVDFVQSVWASVFACPSRYLTFDDPEALQAFLASLAHHKVAEAVRLRVGGRKFNVEREEPLEGKDLPAPMPTPSQVAIAREEWEKLLAGQPGLHRNIVVGRAEGESLGEIAEKLGVSERTVRRVLDKVIQRRAHE